jgi:poly(3-hydroxybutyrate) depolymerase
VVAFPEGINQQWLGDPEAPPKRDLDDIAFAQTLFEQIAKAYCVDIS